MIRHERVECVQRVSTYRFRPRQPLPIRLLRPAAAVANQQLALLQAVWARKADRGLESDEVNVVAQG